MAKELRCGDVVPDCKFTARAENLDELMSVVVEHAREAHGVEEITPELQQKVGAAIRDV